MWELCLGSGSGWEGCCDPLCGVMSRWYASEQVVRVGVQEGLSKRYQGPTLVFDWMDGDEDSLEAHNLFIWGVTNMDCLRRYLLRPLYPPDPRSRRHGRLMDGVL